MIKSKPIKNIEQPPFLFGIRGKLFMKTMVLISVILLFSLMIAFFLAFKKMFLLGFLVVIIGLGIALLLIKYQIKISEIKLFKSLKNNFNIISHINFFKILK